MARIVNLTPHPVVLMSKDGSTVLATFPSEGLARVAQSDELVEKIDVDGIEVDIVRSTFGELNGLPKPRDDVRYVVSLAAAQAAEALGRTDVLVPSGPVRDSKGAIVGCTQFAVV